MSARGARLSATQPAYVLHHYDWSESSLVLDLFTREQGRLAVVAKGAKRPYSQLRSVLLPFQRLQVALSKPQRSDDGQTEVQTLRSAEWIGGQTLPAGAALFSGYYLNELLLKLLMRHDPHPQLFDAYAEALPALHLSDEAQTQAALRAFELRLLRETGVLPDLSVITLTQAPLQAERRYALSAEAGVHASPQGGFDAAALLGLEAALLHGSVAALRQACQNALSPLKPALRSLLHNQLGHKPLRTRAVMLEVQKLID